MDEGEFNEMEGYDQYNEGEMGYDGEGSPGEFGYGEYNEGEMGDGYEEHMMMEGEHDDEEQYMDGHEGMLDNEGEYDEMEGEQMDEEDGEGHGNFEEDYDDGEQDILDFENDPQFAHLPPLNKLRKSRRNILRSINDIRYQFNSKKTDGIKILPISVDHIMERVANEYAEHLLHQQPDPAILQELIDKHEALGSPDTFANSYKCIVGEAFYDTETGDEEELKDVFMDAHGLLFELEMELNELVSPGYTHIAIGLAFTQNQVKVVEILSKKEVRVHTLSATNDGGVEVKGQQILSMEKYGVYAMRICNQKKKETAIISPQFIQIDKKDMSFVGTFPSLSEDVFYQKDNPKFLEIYLRVKPESIAYGVPTTDRINVNVGLLHCLKLPMEFIPDPRTIVEDTNDLEMEEKEKALKLKMELDKKNLKEGEMKARKEMRDKYLNKKDVERDSDDDDKSDLNSDDKMSKSESEKKSEKGSKSPSKKSQTSQEDSESDNDMGQDDNQDTMDDMKDLPSHQEMKKELINAIQQAMKEKEERLQQN